MARATHSGPRAVPAWLLLAAALAACTSARVPGGASVTGEYLMAVHACDTAERDCTNPTNHLVYVVQSDDGRSWTPIPGYEPHPGSVPDLIRRGDTLYVYAPGVVRRYRFTEDRWEDPVPFRATKSDGSSDFPVDPSLVIDAEGRLVMFYLESGGPGSGDPARCAPGEETCSKIVRSATEVDGSDGTRFTVDTGARAEIAIRAEQHASDPDVFADPVGHVMYLSHADGLRVHASETLRGQYRRLAYLPAGVLVARHGVGAGFFVRDADRYWTFVHARAGDVSVIRRAAHEPLDEILPGGAFETVLTAVSLGLPTTVTLESPGFAVNDP